MLSLYLLLGFPLTRFFSLGVHSDVILAHLVLFILATCPLSSHAPHSLYYIILYYIYIYILYCPKIHLPDHSSIATLANTFSSCFSNKISIIHSSFFPSDSHSRVLNPPDTRKVLQNLSCVTADEVCHLVLRAPCKSSDLDPIPTRLVKDCIDILITPMTSRINLSLTEGSFPSHFKSAHVCPLLKKPSLNKNSMNNYRPVSNLTLLSKVLEKVVVNQLNSHINSSNTSNQYQSAYRKFHSTETALLKIHSDISSINGCRQGHSTDIA